MTQDVLTSYGLGGHGPSVAGGQASSANRVGSGAMAGGSSEAPGSGAVAAGSATGVSPVEPAAPCSPAFGCPIPDRPVPDGVEPVDAGRLTPTVTDSNCSTTPTLHGIAIDT